jgi:hypothetical protein
MIGPVARRPGAAKRRLVTWAVLFLIPIAAVAVYCRVRPRVFNESLLGHAHCISVAGGFLQHYADDHEGRFPFHPAGYPQALLMLDAGVSWECMTGPGFEAKPFEAAKRYGTPLTEADCGRVYIQGLTRKSNPQLAILFDKIPTPGGDHCHFPNRLWAPYRREYLTVDCTNSVIDESDWPVFAREQVELLVKEGFARAEAERLYGLAPQ